MTTETPDDITERLRMESRLSRNGGVLFLPVLLDKAADEIKTLRAQVAQYKPDAERWQFWRVRYSALCTEHCARRAGIDLTSTYVNTPEKMDAVTDAAIDKARKS